MARKTHSTPWPRRATGAIAEFLRHYRAAAQKGLKTAQLSQSIRPMSQWVGMIAYWSHAVKCIDWLLWHCGEPVESDPSPLEDMTRGGPTETT